MVTHLGSPPFPRCVPLLNHPSCEADVGIKPAFPPPFSSSVFLPNERLGPAGCLGGQVAGGQGGSRIRQLALGEASRNLLGGVAAAQPVWEKLAGVDRPALGGPLPSRPPRTDRNDVNGEGFGVLPYCLTAERSIAGLV